MESDMKVVAIVQARMSSARLPDKVMKLIDGRPMIELLLTRLSFAKEVNQIVLATSVDERNDPLVSHVEKLGYKCIRGSETDVLERYLKASHESHADVIVRITGDCPLVDPELVDDAIKLFKYKNIDYLNNISPPSYPDGLDIEVFKLSALEQAGRESQELFDREHVTPYLRRRVYLMWKSCLIMKIFPVCDGQWMKNQILK